MLFRSKQTGLLTVTQTALTGGNADEGSQQFRGLERVGYVVDGTAHGWTYRSTTLVSSAGGVTAMLGPFGDDGGVLVDLPSIDVRAALQEGESKIPDDGKLHFEGVTDNTATPTVIGRIPLAENEYYVVTARVTATRYNNVTSGADATYEVTQRVRREIGSDTVGDISESRRLSDEGDAGYDFVLEGDDTAHTINLKVTGVSWARNIWTASVEVQRISDKTYER